MRRIMLSLSAVAAVWAVVMPALGQQTPNIRRIGLLVVSDRPMPVAAFRQGLRELGYVEGVNIIIDYRSAKGQTARLSALATELVALKVDVIVTHSTPGVRAVKKATKTIPIVMASVGNAVRSGLVETVARPGGNVTGNSFFGSELAVKRMEVLRELLPSLNRIAFLAHPTYPEASKRRTVAAAKSSGMKAEVHYAKDPSAYNQVFAEMKRRGIEGVDVLGSPIFFTNRAVLIREAARYGLPTIYPWRHAPREGGLISYGPDPLGLFHRAAWFVDRIFNGAKAADLPVERPTKFEMVVNLKTAKALGIMLPRSILLRADRVIE